MGYSFGGIAVVIPVASVGSHHRSLGLVIIGLTTLGTDPTLLSDDIANSTTPLTPRVLQGRGMGWNTGYKKHNILTRTSGRYGNIGNGSIKSFFFHVGPVVDRADAGDGRQDGRERYGDDGHD